MSSNNTEREFNLFFGNSQIDDPSGDTDLVSETPQTIIEKKKSRTARDKKLNKYIWGLGLEHEVQFFHLTPL